MKTEYVKHLLKLYYEGEISSKDKQLLINYFKQNNISSELKEEAFIFLQIHKDEAIDVPSTLEGELIYLINSAEETRKSRYQISKRKKRHLLFLSTAAAACLIVLLSSIFIINKSEKDEYKCSSHTQDTFFTPELASVETQKALLLISKNLNKGLGKLNAANEDVERMNKIINNSLNTLKRRNTL